MCLKHEALDLHLERWTACRDNIDALLANAVPHDRQMEKTARAWLHACHQNLDKTTIYDNMLPEQQIMRKRFGEQCTFFGQMFDGSRSIEVRCLQSR